jgi:hypothetical protein
VDPNPDLDQKLKKKKQQKFLYIFWDQKLQFTYVQATREAFSSQKRTSSTSKNEIYKLFSMFVGHFCHPGSGLRIRTDPGTQLNPDPQHFQKDT